MSEKPPYKLHRELAEKRLRFALFTVSSSRYVSKLRGEKISDISMDLAIELIERDGHEIIHKDILDDDISMIRERLEKMLEMREVDVIIFMGGTGLARKDLTIEAVKPLFEKEVEGFGEIFRMLSYKRIGAPAILTRATAGVSKGKAIICLPGSPDAVKLALKEFLGELPHLVYLARQ